MSAAPVKIRPRQEEDIPQLARVLVEVHDRDGYPVEGVADPKAWLALDGLLGAWVAEVDGEPLGHVAWTRPGPGDGAAELWLTGHPEHAGSVTVLSRLFVAPEARGRKAGAALTRAVMDAAQHAGQILVLDVMDKDQAAARLYRSLGWVRIGVLSHEVPNSRSVPATAFVWGHLDAKAQNEMSD